MQLVQPSGHRGQLVLFTKKLPKEHRVHDVGLEHTAQPTGHCEYAIAMSKRPKINRVVDFILFVF